MTPRDSLTEFHQTFLHPPRHFGPIPFWFWNDDLDSDELLRQLRAFHAAGCGGVLPHARVGLSRRIGYMTETFLGHIREVVEAAAELGMSVILYDEASYPSGSARGAVAAENPDHASQAIGLWQKEITGPSSGFWRPNTGRALRDRHVVTCGARVQDGQVLPDTVRLLETSPRDIVAYDLPAGDWKLLSVWNTDSGGTIRGAFADEETGSATAPAAGDILNPEAVARFLSLTHDRYRATVGDHFGSTVVAMFTDEPGVFGKSPRRPADPRPYTAGFVDWLAQRWGEDPRPWLPALWLDYGDGTEAFRRRYREAVETRLHEVFYAAQSRWCAAHGLALTGHPAASNDMASLSAFQLPGQDTVWRWVLPGAESALEGAHSVAPKAATGGARRVGARRVLTEVCGAYGWRLSLDEIKWLFDWHLVRGNNLINPHALYYSIRGRRAWESEPDLGVHNVWWPHVGHLLRYAGRLSWLLSDAEPVIETAIVGQPSALPWSVAARLLTTQRDFTYIGPADVVAGRVRCGRLHVGGAAYTTVLVDGDPDPEDRCDWRARLQQLRESGGTVVWHEDDPAGLPASLPRTVEVNPATVDLRCCHVRKAGVDLFFLVNEGETEVAGSARLPADGVVEAWDPLWGRRQRLAATRIDGETVVDLELPRRGSIVLAVDPAARAADVGAPAAGPVRYQAVPSSAWEVTDRRGDGVGLRGLGDWSREPGHELFSGTRVYRTRFEVAHGLQVRAAGIDLGDVGDVAECFCDGEPVGLCLWAPYRLPAGALGPLAVGAHDLEIRVTNSMANEYEGAQLPSGLMGPVRLLYHTL